MSQRTVRRSIMAVDPAYPCGCTIPHPNGYRVCGRVATFGIVYSTMLLPVCAMCAAELIAAYRQQPGDEDELERAVNDGQA